MSISGQKICAVVPTRILRKWDAEAFEQLCQVAAAQAVEIDDLRREARTADDSAEFWREQAIDMQLQLCERTGGEPGITLACQLVVVPS